MQGAGVPAVAIVLLAIVAAGCGAQDTGGMVRSSDPELAALAAELLPDLARRSGMELREPVRVEKRSRDELVRYLEYKLDEELPRAEAQAIVDSYALLGLVDADLDLRNVLLGMYTEQVAGFYEPDSTALFVMDDQDDEAVRALLLHELVHAVQDQTVDLDALTDSELGSDRVAAAQAAIEGHATLVMFEYVVAEQMGGTVDLSTLPQFGALLRQSLAGAESEFEALAGAPRILRESLIFPYLEGAIFLQQLWARGERVVPFGDRLPGSTEEILFGADTPDPVELSLVAAGGTAVHEDVLGRLELGILLEELGVAGGATPADGWDGDRFALVERADGGRVLVSYVIWQDAAARAAFVTVFEPALGRLGGAAKLETVDVAGRLATRLTVGDDAGVRVTATERR